MRHCRAQALPFSSPSRGETAAAPAFFRLPAQPPGNQRPARPASRLLARTGATRPDRREFSRVAALMSPSESLAVSLSDSPSEAPADEGAHDGKGVGSIDTLTQAREAPRAMASWTQVFPSPSPKREKRHGLRRCFRRVRSAGATGVFPSSSSTPPRAKRLTETLLPARRHHEIHPLRAKAPEDRRGDTQQRQGERVTSRP